MFHVEILERKITLARAMDPRHFGASLFLVVFRGSQKVQRHYEMEREKEGKLAKFAKQCNPNVEEGGRFRGTAVSLFKSAMLTRMPLQIPILFVVRNRFCICPTEVLSLLHNNLQDISPF